MTTAAERVDAAPRTITTTVAALFLHGPHPSEQGDPAPTPMRAVREAEAVAARGLRGDTRYFRGTRRDGGENLRQVSLIDEGTLARHEERFGPIPWETVKSQIVLAGDLRLPDLLGRQIVFGEGEDAAILELTIPRQPCYAMDLIVPGLREAMKEGEQGALARVVRGGPIHVGQAVTVR